MCRGDGASTGTPAAPALAAEAAVPRSFAPLSLRTTSRRLAYRRPGICKSREAREGSIRATERTTPPLRWSDGEQALETPYTPTLAFEAVGEVDGRTTVTTLVQHTSKQHRGAHIEVEARLQDAMDLLDHVAVPLR
jgi:hypothetical protein